MSGPSVEEKLAVSHSTEGRARRTYSSFFSSKSGHPEPGFREVLSGKPPRLVALGVMEPSLWKWVSGEGASAVYERAEGGE